MITLWVLLYLVMVGLGNCLAYRRFNRQWSRRERARFVIGVLVVVLPALLASVVGPLDLLTVLVVLGGFGLAGGLTIALDIEGETTGPALLESVLVIHRHNRAIRGKVFDQRDKIRSAR